MLLDVDKGVQRFICDSQRATKPLRFGSPENIDPQSAHNSMRMLKDDVIVQYRQVIEVLTFTPHYGPRPFQYSSRGLYRRYPGATVVIYTALTAFAGLYTTLRLLNLWSFSRF